jgi:hypothetical protein
MRSHSLRCLSLAVALFCAVLAVPAHAGNPASSGIAVGFARVRLSDGSVSGFGGRGTKDVTTGPTGTGVIVFFDGRYSKKLTREQVIVQATAEADESGQLAVANAIVADADNSHIVVTVNGWIAGTETQIDGYVFLTVYAGVAPEVK